MKALLFSLILCLAFLVAAQTEHWPTPPNEPVPYTIFCEESRLVDSLMDLQADSLRHTLMPYKLPNAQYALLSKKERLIHAIRYPERYTQICSHSFFNMNEYNEINPYIRTSFGMVKMSSRQQQVLKEDSLMCIEAFNSCLRSGEPMYNHLPELIVDYNYISCIPAIIDAYNNPSSQNTYQLTALMLLMKKNNYAPFLETKLYHTLYDQNTKPKKQIKRKKKYSDEIIALAKKFYEASLH